MTSRTANGLQQDVAAFGKAVDAFAGTVGCIPRPVDAAGPLIQRPSVAQLRLRLRSQALPHLIKMQALVFQIVGCPMIAPTATGTESRGAAFGTMANAFANGFLLRVHNSNANSGVPYVAT